MILNDLQAAAGLPASGAVAAPERWDAGRLAMALHSDPERAKRLRDWARACGLSEDLHTGRPRDEGPAQSAADWRNQILRAMAAGRKAGSGIGRPGASLADRPGVSRRRPSRPFIARLAEAERQGGALPVFEPGYRRTGAEVHLLAFDETVHLSRRLDPAGWREQTGHPLRTGGGTVSADLFDRARAFTRRSFGAYRSGRPFTRPARVSGRLGGAGTGRDATLRQAPSHRRQPGRRPDGHPPDSAATGNRGMAEGSSA